LGSGGGGAGSSDNHSGGDGGDGGDGRSAIKIKIFIFKPKVFKTLLVK
jgi:hypothetical protein